MPRPAPPILTHALELFAPLGALRTKAMFGGWGFYSDELFFALIADEQLYLKTDAHSRPRFIAAGSAPFAYLRKGERVTLDAYWRAPETALDSPAAMLPWAREALAAAVRARGKPRTRRS